MGQESAGELMRILGIDPGLTKENPTGAALLVCPGPRLLGTVAIRPMRGDWQAQLRGVVERLHSDYLNSVDLCAVEWPHVEINAQSALKLAALCGAILAACALRRVEVVIVQPSQAKVALAGRGGADKAAMIEAVRVQFGVVLEKDRADAVGVALAGWAAVKEGTLR